MRAAVLGSPVAHSLSPVLHRAAYGELALPWTYTSHQVDRGELAAFLDGLDPEWVGLSLTMPLKHEALPLMDWVSPRARAVAAVNTVLLSRGRRMGTNTDVPGMSNALAERGTSVAASGTVLGGGSTARSALAALSDLGVRSPVVVLRRPEAAADLHAAAQRLGQCVDVRRWAPGPALDAALCADVVVSTVPGEAGAGLADALPAVPGTLLDAVYDPWPTTLAARWSSRGGAVVGGLDLLVHQAVLQVTLMTGRDDRGGRLLPRLREAAESALAARRG